MNSNTIAGKWNEVKGELRKTWGKITDDEWEQTKGDSQSIVGLVEQRYGLAKEEISERLNSFFGKDAARPVKDAVEGVKEKLRSSNDKMATDSEIKNSGITH